MRKGSWSKADLLFGIDVSKKWLSVTFKRVNGEKVGVLQVPNNRIGFIKLITHVERRRRSRVVAGIESTSLYWENLARFLKQNGVKVVLVNPYHVKRTKELIDNNPSKHDKKDSEIICDLVRIGYYVHEMLPYGIYAELRELTNFRLGLKKKLGRLKGEVREILERHFPEYEDCFYSILSPTSLAVLRSYGLPFILRKVNVKELAELISKASRGKLGWSRAHMIINAAKLTVGTEGGIEAAYSKLQLLFKELDLYLWELKEIESKIKRRVEEIPVSKYLLSIPGVGEIVLAGILAEAGDLRKFKSARALEKLAGLSLVTNDSGDKKGLRCISKKGRSLLRRYLYQIALVCVAKNKEFKEFYKYHTKILKRNSMKVLTKLAAKILRVMYGLVKHGSFYDPKKIFENIRYREAVLVIA